MLYPTFNEKGVPNQKMMLSVDRQLIALADKKKLIMLTISHKGLVKATMKNRVFEPQLIIAGQIEITDADYNIDRVIRYLSTASYEVYGSKKALITMLYKRIYKDKVFTFYAIVPKPIEDLLDTYVAHEIIKEEKRYYIIYTSFGLFGVLGNNVKDGKGLMMKINKTYSVWVYK